MLVIIAGHIAVIAAVMSAKMDLPQRIRDATEVRLIPLPPAPPPQPQPQPRAAPEPGPSTIDRLPVIVPVPQPPADELDSPVGAAVPGTPSIGPMIQPLPVADPVRIAARFATPASAIRPPYPPSKVASEEEAVLKLRLSIDPHGRVIAVEPLGRADPAFLAAARRHLMAHWRYQPATVDGSAIASATTITLRFELD
jgi:protein TonB